MTDNVNFVAYPDVSAADLLTMRFTSDSFARKAAFLESDTVDTDVSFEDLYAAMSGGSSSILGNRSSAGASIYGEDADTGILYLLQTGTNTVWVYVSGDSPEETADWIQKFSEGCPPVQNKDDVDHVQVNFWMLTNTPLSVPRSLEVFHWDEVKRNYPDRVNEQLDELFHSTPPEVGGKLVLWHGDPGGGKTSAIKALADAWRDWAVTEYITDPEAFFGNAAYMLSVLNRRAAGDDRWRLIVVEDAGQFIVKDADVKAGQSFSRLLNLTDGLLGQGMKTILLITTNQGLQEMHPALTRPGRCMANIQFDKFSSTEASSWLGRTVHESMTLAEMYEDLSETLIETKKASVTTGQYL